MEKLIGIYKITSPSERVYIGQSIDIHKRWKTYTKLYKSNQGQILLNNSFQKYGVENHIFEIIEECKEKDLNCRERFWQDEFNVLQGGLNCILQECGEKLRILSKETLQRKSKASKGEKNGMFGRCGDLNPNFGKVMSEESKLNQSNKMKGKYVGELNPFYGQHHSEEVLYTLSEKAKLKVGVLNPFYGKSHTEEYKQKSSERASEFYRNNPELKLYLKEVLSIGLYYTPAGVFMSQNDAAKANGIAKATVRNRCIKNSDKKVGHNMRVPEESRGDKTWRDNGWYFILKDKQKPN